MGVRTREKERKKVEKGWRERIREKKDGWNMTERGRRKDKRGRN